MRIIFGPGIELVIWLSAPTVFLPNMEIYLKTLLKKLLHYLMKSMVDHH